MIDQQMRNGVTQIDMGLKERHLLSEWMLGFPLRNYVIKVIKNPIRKALEAGKTFSEVMPEVIRSMARLPKFGRTNLRQPTVLITKAITDKIIEHHHNPERELMVQNAIKLLLSEDEHDNYYAWLKDYIVIELAIEVVKGNYKPRMRRFPIPACWSGGDLPSQKEIRERIKEIVYEYSDT